MAPMLPYSERISSLLSDRLPELGAGQPNTAMRPQLASLTPASLFAGQKIHDSNAARACLSGLWLGHAFLDESHAISQEIHTIEGSFWHGIMHRREGDYGNAKYWFRRVPAHAIFEPLGQAASELAASADLDGPSEYLRSQSTWDPYRFVDLCEAIARGRSKCETLARQIAAAEWRLLFGHCYQLALGGQPGEREA